MTSSDSTRDSVNAGANLPSRRTFGWLGTWLFAACSGLGTESGTPPQVPPAIGAGDASFDRGEDDGATRGTADGVAAEPGAVSMRGTAGEAVPGASGAGGTESEAGAAGSAAGSERDSGAVADATLTDATTGAPPKRQCLGLDLPARALAAPVSDLSALEPYYPTTGFRTAEPAAAGMDAAKLNEALTFSTPHSSTEAILVLRKGYIVAERYFGTSTADTRFESFSIAKGFTSALVGIAIGAGKIPGIDARLCEYYPEWDCEDAQDPRSRITIEHAMNLRTGLEWSEAWTPEGLLTNDAVWGFASLNFVDYVLAKPAVTEPGTEMRYSTGSPALLTGVIQAATGKTAFAYAKEVLFDPIGTPDVLWDADLAGRTTTFAGLQATAREFAKFGYLYAQRGQWEGREVVPASWVDLTTRGASCDERYRFLWHLSPMVRFGMLDAASCNAETFLSCRPLALANLPEDGFFAQGITGQFIFIFPRTDLVVVRMASDEFNGQYWDEYARELLGRLFDAIR